MSDRSSSSSRGRRRPSRTTPAASATGWSACRPAGRWTTSPSGSSNRAVGNRPAAAGLECTATGPTLALRHGRPSCASAAPTWAPTLDGRPGAALAADRGRRRAGAAPRPAGRRRPAHLRRGAGRARRARRCWGAGRPSPSAASAATRAGPSRPATSSPSATARRPRCARRRCPRRLALDRAGAGASACSRARTPRPTSSPPTTSTPSSPPSGGCRCTAPAPGVRLDGPRPAWARPDGGDAGLHPSNIHDTGYAFGTVDFTGDTPVRARPRRPQPGRLHLPGHGGRRRAVEARPAGAGRHACGSCRSRRTGPPSSAAPADVDAARCGRRAADASLSLRRDPTSRRARADPAGGDRPTAHDPPLGRRLRARRVRRHDARPRACGPGSTPSTPGWPTHGPTRSSTSPPGVRSLLVQVDPDRSSPSRRSPTCCSRATTSCPPTDALAIDARTVHLPLSWEDPATLEAIRRYMDVVRDDAPWCPSNLEFIRRINGLDVDRRRAPDRVRRRRTSCSASATCTSGRRWRRRSTPATGW